MGRAGAAALVLAVAVGVPVMRELTMAVDTPATPGTETEVVVRARLVREPPGGRAAMTRALVDLCRLEVDAALVADGYRRRAADEYRFLLRPGLDESDSRRLHGCLEDARAEHLQVDVLRMRTADLVADPAAAPGPPVTGS